MEHSTPRLVLVTLGGAALLALGATAAGAARAHAGAAQIREGGHAHDRARRGARRPRPDARAHVRRADGLPAHVREALRPEREARTSSRSSPRRCRQISKDKLTYTIKMRSGIKFNDGTPLNGDAVKKSLEPLPDVQGLDARERDLADRLGRRDGPQHGRLHLKAPFSPLTAQLADRAGMIMSPKQLDARRQVRAEPRLRRAVRVQGPRRPATTSRSSSRRLLRQEKVHLDSIVFRIMTDPSSRTQTLRRATSRSKDRVQSTDVPTLQEDKTWRAQGADDRLPGDHAEHRQQERPAQVPYPNVGTPIASRSTCAPRSTWHSTARRSTRSSSAALNLPDCYPISPVSPWYVTTKGLQCNRTRTSPGEEARQGLGHPDADQGPPDDRHRPGQRAPRPGDPGDGEKVGFDVDLDPTEFVDLAEQGGRGEVRRVRGRLVGPRRPGRQHLRLRLDAGHDERLRLLEHEARLHPQQRPQVGDAEVAHDALQRRR